MAKYYVQTGNIQVVISAPWIKTAEEAVCEILLQYARKLSPAPLCLVGERGFEWEQHDIEEYSVFSTVDLLHEIGLIKDDEE